jgi:AcrR family transcriptional regulator
VATRTRRSTADIRALLLKAARELFLEEGYDATTTRQISERAGVAEPLLFTNFGSKGALFDAAVLTPIADFVAEYASSFAAAPEGERVDAFVRGLYDLAGRNRTVLLDAVVQRPDVLDHLAVALQGLSGVSDLDQYDDVDAPAAVAAAIGMVLGVALLDDLLFPAGSRRPGRDRLIAEMEKFILYGTTRRGP